MLRFTKLRVSDNIKEIERGSYENIKKNNVYVNIVVWKKIDDEEMFYLNLQKWRFETWNFYRKLKIPIIIDNIDNFNKIGFI